MLGGVAGRHMSTRRRGSSPMVRLGETEVWAPPPLPPSSPRYRRRRAVTTSDFKSCALVQTRMKLGDIILQVHEILEKILRLDDENDKKAVDTAQFVIMLPVGGEVTEEKSGDEGPGDINHLSPRMLTTNVEIFTQHACNENDVHSVQESAKLKDKSYRLGYSNISEPPKN